MRFFWIQVVRVIHVFGAIAGIGPTLVYGFWQARADKAGAPYRLFALRTTKWVDDRFTTPALWSQVVTGVTLALLEGRSILHTAWILLSLILLVVMGVIAVLTYLPVSKRQIVIAERLTAEADVAAERDYAIANRQAGISGVTVSALTLAIVVLMVAKPPLWSAG